MKVSVIIPTFNEEKTIGECLTSTFEQDYEDFEVIVVDDGSTDTTPLKLRGASKTYGIKIKVLNQEHKGPGAARNLGVRKARGEILVFVDADMTFEKEFLTKLVKPILEGKAIGTWSREEFVSNTNNIWSKCWSINEGWEAGRRHPKNYPDTQPVFRAILKKKFEEAGGFDEDVGYTDDWSISRKLRVQAINAPGARFYHKNPEALPDVFQQARWVGKRPYKFGILGSIVALIRASLPVSLVVGTIKAIFHQQPYFVVFKIIYDFGVFLGILEYLFLGKTAK